MNTTACLTTTEACTFNSIQFNLFPQFNKKTAYDTYNKTQLKCGKQKYITILTKDISKSGGNKQKPQAYHRLVPKKYNNIAQCIYTSTKTNKTNKQEKANSIKMEI